jgi:hypothetical protein
MKMFNSRWEFLSVILFHLFFFFIHISPLLSPFWHCKEVCSIGIGSGGKMANASVMLDVGFDSIKCSF